MKKTLVTIAIVLGLGMTAFADPYGGGLFKRGTVIDDEEFYGAGYYRDGGMLTPGLPNHNLGDNQDAPVGSGIVLLTALGGAYLVAKKRKEE